MEDHLLMFGLSDAVRHSAGTVDLFTLHGRSLGMFVEHASRFMLAAVRGGL